MSGVRYSPGFGDLRDDAWSGLGRYVGGAAVCDLRSGC